MHAHKIKFGAVGSTANVNFFQIGQKCSMQYLYNAIICICCLLIDSTVTEGSKVRPLVQAK